MFSGIKAVATAMLIAALPVSAQAYEIGSANPLHLALDVHETITELARQCEGEAGEDAPDCRQLLSQLADTEVVTNHERAASNDIIYAVRWPDDPSRNLDRAITKGKFAVNTGLTSCSPYVGEGQRIDETDLLCASHFGRLSFFHAMVEPGTGFTPERTRELLLAAAAFSFEVATDAEYRNGDYCDAVQALANSDLKEALTLANQDLCEKRPKRLFGFIPFFGHWDPWAVRTLFAFDCRNPFSSNICWESKAEFGDETASAAATGAILHMIQDSFSQSHAYRSPGGSSGPLPEGPYTSLISCGAPTAFYDYKVQGEAGSDIHGEADQRPSIDDNCYAPDLAVDDPVTASAQVIRFVKNGDAAGFEQYMRCRVFPSPQGCGSRSEESP